MGVVVPSAATTFVLAYFPQIVSMMFFSTLTITRFLRFEPRILMGNIAQNQPVHLSVVIEVVWGLVQFRPLGLGLGFRVRIGGLG